MKTPKITLFYFKWYHFSNVPRCDLNEKLL